MITWVTVWVLTVGYFDTGHYKGGSATYQLQFAKQETCLKEAKKHLESSTQNTNPLTIKTFARCDFQQVPVVINKLGKTDEIRANCILHRYA